MRIITVVIYEGWLNIQNYIDFFRAFIKLRKKIVFLPWYFLNESIFSQTMTKWAVILTWSYIILFRLNLVSLLYLLYTIYLLISCIKQPKSLFWSLLMPLISWLYMTWNKCICMLNPVIPKHTLLKISHIPSEYSLRSNIIILLSILVCF